MKGSRSFHKTEAAQEITYQAKLKYPAPNTSLQQLEPHLTALFESLIEEMLKKYGERGVARIYIDHPNLEKAIIITPRYISDMTVADILDYIDDVVSSAGEIPADEALNINVAVIRSILGNGRKYIFGSQDIVKKRSIVAVKNDDNTCLPRAIVIGIANLNLKNNPEDPHYRKVYDTMRDSRRIAQYTEAVKLRKAVGIGDRVGLLEDVKLYEDYLKVNIIVVSLSCNRHIYTGSNQYKERIYLLHSQNSPEDKVGHFDVITNIGGALCCQYFCESCNKGFKNRDGHKCKVWCNVCGKKDCEQQQMKKCENCNRICRSEQCYKRHKRKVVGKVGINKHKVLPSMCEQNFECSDCGILLKTEKRKPSEHVCGETYCNFCNQYYMDYYHECYMRSMTPETHSDKFIFYDFECQQDNDKGIHVPNLVVAQSVCDHCENEVITTESKCFSCGSRCNMCNKYNSTLKEYEYEPCGTCGFRQVIFSGPDTNKKFCRWLLNESHKNFTVIAHNARSYDAYFVYDYMMTCGLTPDPVIFSGSKIMYMHLKNINLRLLDSLNFLPMPLAKLPKSFGLTELKKGFFPHFFNTKKNQNVVLPFLPEMKYYDPDSMSKERREEFLIWYDENKNNQFNFQKEMLDYCISDVDILLKACCKFRNLMLEATGTKTEVEDIHNMFFKTIYENSVDPFAFLTIASVCMGVFRSKFLPEEWLVLTEEEASKNPSCNHHDAKCTCEWMKGRKLNGFSEIEVNINDQWISTSDLKICKMKFHKSPIGIIPSYGYSGDKHSKSSIEWLKLLERDMCNSGKNVKIQHARTDGGEKVVFYKNGTKPTIKYKLDGYFEYDGTKYACEFNGCNWHGCPKCYQKDRETELKNGKSLAQRYRETVLKAKRLKELGFTVINIWSCEFQQLLKDNKEKADFVENLHIQEPINLRDCYFGGRTNALILYKEMKSGEKAYYYDFTSLYPSVMKYRDFPVGHPTRIVEKFKGLTTEKCPGQHCMYDYHCNGEHIHLQYFGIIKAKFIPPRKLLHPVLPIRCNGKLMFPLCYKCATTQNQNECKCSIKDRSFIHTYCTIEVEVALNMGYIIEEIYEILHWPERAVYNSREKKGGLFTHYVNTFLQLKQQASGLPESVCTEQQFDKYIDEYQKNEGILLNRNLIEKNPGLRSISKLALNSFYGKFGQKTNMKKSKFVSDIGVFFNTLTDNTKDLADFHIMNENMILLEYKQSEDFLLNSGNTNVIISAFCTSWARLALWHVMNRLGHRVMYHDTDSIIFSVSPEDEYIPELGDYLGDLTSELTCKEIGCNGCETGHWIQEFVSCGPKNYSFMLNTGEVICKVRGFSLNYSNSQILNFESMKEALFTWRESGEQVPLQTVKTEIHRHKYQNPVVYTKHVKKSYSVVYDKRRVVDNFKTLPYGF